MTAAGGRHAGSASLLAAESALRHPDVHDRAGMTRRAWTLLGLHLLVPGSVQLLAGSRALGRTGLGVWFVAWGVAIAALVTWIAAPAALLALPTTSGGLTVLQIALLGWAALWLVLSVDTLRLAGVGRLRPAARPAVVLLLVLALVGGSGVAAYAAYLSGVARGTVRSLFVDKPAVAASAGRYNLLLLGGDRTKGAYRLDAVSVVSIDASSGAVATVGLPPETAALPVPTASPLADRFDGATARCGGADCDLRSLYTAVERSRLYPGAAADNTTRGALGVKDALQSALGIRLQYAITLDLDAFGRLVDALDGITVTVPAAVVVGSGEAGTQAAPERFRAGRQRFDGARAAAYVRTTTATGDYAALTRQRRVQTAILTQASPANLLLKFQFVAGAGTSAVSTNIPEDLLSRLAAVAISAKGRPIRGVELAPPTVSDPVHPDWSAARAAVQRVLK